MPNNAPDHGIIATGIASMLPFNDTASRTGDQTWLEFNPKPGEDYGTWSTRLKAAGAANPKYGAALNSAVTRINDPKIKGWFDMVSTSPDAAGAGGQGPLDRNKAVDDFYRMMMDPNAPELKAAQEQATIRSEQGMSGAGIGGGMANASAARAGLDSRNAMQFQRQTAGMAAIQNGMNYDARMQGQLFDQNQSNQINSANQQRALMQAGVAAGGQIVSGVVDAAKGSGSGTGAAGGGAAYQSPASGMTNPYGGVGAGSNVSVTQPSEWNNPYGGY